MPTVFLPTLVVESVDIGPTTIPNPSSLILEIGSTVYGDQFVGLSDANINRQVFPIFEQSTGKVKLTCVTLAHATDAPAVTVNNIKVYVVG
jgi:hypothetical protein